MLQLDKNLWVMQVGIIQTPDEWLQVCFEHDNHYWLIKVGCENCNDKSDCVPYASSEVMTKVIVK